MADFPITIEVDPRPGIRAVDQVEKSFEHLEQTTNQVVGKMGGTFDSLKTSLLGVAAAFATVATAREAAAAVIDLSDRYTSLDNRLRQVTTGTQELAQVHRDLFEVAQRSRASFEDVASTYGRVRNSLARLGFTSHETEIFTESLSKALAASGKTSAEVSAAQLQLSQALASGRLQGDEFRTITEAFPELLTLIAQRMGVTTDKIKQLSSEGKISAKILADSLINAAGQIDEKFGRAVPTVGQAIQLLRNDILELVGGLIGGLGPAFVDVEAAVRSAIAGLVEMAGTVRELVGNVTELVTANLVGELRGIEAAAKFAVKELGVMGGVLASLGNSKSALHGLVGGFGELGQKISDVTDNLDLSGRALDKFIAHKEALLEDAHAVERRAIAAKEAADEEERLREAGRKIVGDVRNTQKFIAEGLAESKREARAAKTEHDQFVRSLQQVLNVANPYEEDMLKLVKAHRLLERAVAEGILTTEEATKAEKDYLRAVTDTAKGVASAAAIAQRDIEATREAQKKAAIERSEFLAGLPGEAREASDGLSKLAEAFAEVGRNTPHTEIGRMRLELLSLRDELGSVQDLTHGAVVGAFHDLEDAATKSLHAVGIVMGDLLTKGKADWHEFGQSLKSVAYDFVNVIIEQLERVLVEIALVKLLGLAAGGGSAGVGFSTLGAAVGALGGSAGGSRTVIGGDTGYDANIFAARVTRGEVVTVQRQDQLRAAEREGGGGAAPGWWSPPTIVNHVDAMSIVDQLQSPRGVRAYANVVRLNGSIRALW